VNDIGAQSAASILLVDDNAANLFALGEVLLPLGHQLVEAKSGDEALRLVEDRAFAVVLMDAQMPGLDGFETTQLIKAREKFRYLPIIFLTAFDHENLHAARGYGLGAVDYLIKPIDPHILRCKVEVFVELYLQREENRRKAEALHTEQMARVAAEAGVVAREEMLAIVSHEMCGPVSSVGLYTNLVASRAASIGDDKIVEYAARQKSATLRLERMVRDLLDATRIEGRNLVIETRPWHVADIVDTVVRELSATASLKSQALVSAVDPALTVICDRDRICQVIANLIGNALKFSREGSTVDIVATPAVGEVVVSVMDSGPGIPAPDIERLFDRYWQADARKRSGLGLGLTIARGLVEAHGGRMWVQSTVGRGSSFYFSLPAGP
jgi:signal transduction histidine kinase